MNRASETYGTPGETPIYVLRESQSRRERKGRKVLENIMSKNSQIWWRNINCTSKNLKELKQDKLRDPHLELINEPSKVAGNKVNV